MKRFVLVITMVLAIPIFASETAEPKGSSFFLCSSVYLCEVSSNYFEAWFEVTGVRTMDEIGANQIKIQRSSDGVHWTTMVTCPKEEFTYFVTYNDVCHVAGVRYGPVPGYYYRAYVELYAKKGVNVGYMDHYSAPVYIPAN